MKKVITNSLGNTFESKSQTSSKSDQIFLWKKNLRDIDKLEVLQEKISYKQNSFKSKSARKEFVYWRRYNLKFIRMSMGTEHKFKHSMLKKSHLAVRSAPDGEKLEEIFSDTSQQYLNKLQDLTVQLRTEFLSFRGQLDVETPKESKPGLVTSIKEVFAKSKAAFAEFLASTASIEAVEFEGGESDNSKEKQFFTDLKTLKAEKKLDVTQLTTNRAEEFKALEGLNPLDKFFLGKRTIARKHAVASTSGSLASERFEDGYQVEFENRRNQVVLAEGSEILTTTLDFATNISKLQLEYNEEKLDKTKYASQLAEFKATKAEMKAAFKAEWSEERDAIRAGGGSANSKRVAYKNTRNAYVIEVRNTKLKMVDRVLKRNKLSVARNEARNTTKALSRLMHENVVDLNNLIPIEMSTSKFWLSSILGAIIPGFGALMNKQYIKAALLGSATILSIVALAWIFGAFPSKYGNGIVGLDLLGYDKDTAVKNFAIGMTDGEPNDARFYLVVGAMAAIVLVAILMFWAIQALNNINVNNLARIGIRPTNWRQQKKLLRTSGLPYLLSAPALFFTLFIVVLPLLATLLIAFTNIGERSYEFDAVTGIGKYNKADGISNPIEWVGFDQFSQITDVLGSQFTDVLTWTLIWTFASSAVVIALGTLLAVLVNQKRIYGKTLFRVIYLLPWSIPAFITIMFFSIFFSYSGTFNDVMGFDTDWVNGGGSKTKTLMIFMQGWLGHSYMFLLITGMLQSIPKSLYEAARIDGSSDWKQFTGITAPIIITQIAPLLIGQFTFAFNNFGMIYLFNGGGNALEAGQNSAGESDIFISWIYKLVAQGTDTKPGTGAALSLIVSIFVVTPSAYLFLRSKSFRKGEF